MTSLRKTLLATLIVGLASSFYVYEFFLRVMPSVITEQLMLDFQISAGHLSMMTSCFLYAYAAMQLPSGLLIDRYGPRKCLTIAVVICALATYLFQLSTHVAIGSLTRLLIGGASAFAFIAPLTLASRWFALKRFALIAGMIQLLGCVGAIAGGSPIAYITNLLGWRQALVWSTWFGIALGLIFWLIIRDWPDKRHRSYIKYSKKESEWKRLKQVCREPQNWLIGIVGFSTWSAMGTLAELWGVPFFMKKLAIPAHEAALLILIVWLGVALGSPITGWWSNHIQSRRKPLLLLLTISLLTSCLLIYIDNLGHSLRTIILFLLGFSAGAQPITFALIADNNAKGCVGTAFGFNNMAVVSGAFLLQPMIGYLLDWSWDGTMTNGIPVYQLHDYKLAFAVIPLASLIGLLVTYFGIHETLNEKK